MVAGSGTDSFITAAQSAGIERMVDGDRIVCAEGESGAELFARLSQLAPEPALVVGMGNIGGPGHELADAYRRASATGAKTIAKEVA